MTFVLGFRTSLAVLATKLHWYVTHTRYYRGDCIFRVPRTGEEIPLPRNVSNPQIFNRKRSLNIIF